MSQKEIERNLYPVKFYEITCQPGTEPFPTNTTKVIFMKFVKVSVQTLRRNELVEDDKTLTSLQGDLVDANWTALLRTQPCSPEDAAFREWLNSFPKERRFSPAGGLSFLRAFIFFLMKLLEIGIFEQLG